MEQDIISFDKEKFPIDLMLLNHLKGHGDYTSIDSLDNLHKYVDKSDVSVVEKIIYDFFTTREFQDVYSNLCCDINKNKFLGNAYFQKIPSIRIAMPGVTSVNFHTDNWYGHGDEVCNFWMPITHVHDSMSLAVLSEIDSKNLIKSFESSKITINEINIACQEKAHYLNMKFGEIYCFNSKTLHGTQKNMENKSRVSMDFRSRKLNQSTGTKSNSFFFNPCNLESIDKQIKPSLEDDRAIVYISSRNQNLINLSQKYQQIICLRYAQELNLKVIALETELQGFDYLINLNDMLYGSKMGMYKHLIIFSKEQVNIHQHTVQELFENAKNLGISIHFVLEDHVWRN